MDFIIIWVITLFVPHNKTCLGIICQQSGLINRTQILWVHWFKILNNIKFKSSYAQNVKPHYLQLKTRSFTCYRNHKTFNSKLLHPLLPVIFEYGYKFLDEIGQTELWPQWWQFLHQNLHHAPTPDRPLLREFIYLFIFSTASKKPCLKSAQRIPAFRVGRLSRYLRPWKSINIVRRVPVL